MSDCLHSQQAEFCHNSLWCLFCGLSPSPNPRCCRLPWEAAHNNGDYCLSNSALRGARGCKSQLRAIPRAMGTSKGLLTLKSMVFLYTLCAHQHMVWGSSSFSACHWTPKLSLLWPKWLLILPETAAGEFRGQVGQGGDPGQGDGTALGLFH